MSEPKLALSLIQPWAWAVIHGPKNVENRTWWSTIRGPIWIAASAQVTRRYYAQAAELIKDLGGIEVPPMAELDYGCIIGSAQIVDCILPGGHELARQESLGSTHVWLSRHRARGTAPGPRHPLHPQRWHFIDQFGYVLADRKPVARTVPCRGHQRWWTVPDPVLEQLRGQA